MSQNATLDRETVATTGEAAETVAPPETAMPYAQREHLTLVAWDAAPTIVAQNFTPVRPARRPWFGWSEVGFGLLLLASGAGAAASLLHLH